MESPASFLTRTRAHHTRPSGWPRLSPSRKPKYSFCRIIDGPRESFPRAVLLCAKRQITHSGGIVRESWQYRVPLEGQHPVTPLHLEPGTYGVVCFITD